MPPVVLTDSEKHLRPPAIRNRFVFWLDFSTSITSHHVFRRWFDSTEARDRYIEKMPQHAHVIEKGQEP